MDSNQAAVNTLLSYIRDMIYSNSSPSLDYSLLPEPFEDLGKGLEYLYKLIAETKKFAHELAKGKLDVQLPPPSNEIAAPLKELHASLKHLTWQTQQISKGDYSQQVVFMGDFSAAFNNMIKQLDRHFTELEEAKSEAEKARELADKASRSKTEFLAKMSHEIRTPMNAILGMSELALREKDSGKKNEHIILAKQAASNLLSIINDILDFSKIEAGKMEIIDAEYSITSLINDMTSIIKMRVAGSKIRFIINAAGDIPKTLIGDETRIRQAVLNLLNNAVKYTEKGFVQLGVSCEFINDNVLNLIFEIEDSGIGIKQEDMDKLFSDFTQFDIEKHRGIEGVGLGLAITHSIVKAMGGHIKVESDYGKGSTFTVAFPQKFNSRAPLAEIRNNSSGNLLNIADSESVVKFTAPSASVLIVDDIRTNLKVAEGLLAPYKMQIDLCNSGAAAIEAVKSKQYDIIFMDHKMPVMDGIEATKRIREWEQTISNEQLAISNEKSEVSNQSNLSIDQDKKQQNCSLLTAHCSLPIIALTANAIAGMREMFLENGFSDFISKPIDTAALNLILEKWIPKEKQMVINMTESE